MNNIQQIVCLLILSIATLSCNSYNQVETQTCSKNPQGDFEQTFKTFNSQVFFHHDLLGDLLSAGTLRSIQDGTVEERQEEVMDTITDSLLSSSKAFLSQLGISDSDILLAYNTKRDIKELTDEDIVGLALFLHSCFVANGVGETNNLRATVDRAKDCFLEATGIAAGVGVIGALTGKALSKSALKAVLKLAAKVGGRSLAGIGLALVAAEFTYCMMTDEIQ